MRVRSKRIDMCNDNGSQVSYGDKFERVEKLARKKLNKAKSTPRNHPPSRVVLFACKPRTQKIRKEKPEFQASFGYRIRPSLSK